MSAFSYIRMDPTYQFPCEEPREEDRRAALTAAARAVARLERHTGDRLQWFVMLYVEMLQSHIKLPLGVAFLEQCLSQAKEVLDDSTAQIMT